eukprot:3542833-Pyramimonas_sp.AAC.1
MKNGLLTAFWYGRERNGRFPYVPQLESSQTSCASLNSPRETGASQSYRRLTSSVICTFLPIPHTSVLTIFPTLLHNRLSDHGFTLSLVCALRAIVHTTSTMIHTIVLTLDPQLYSLSQLMLQIINGTSALSRCTKGQLRLVIRVRFPFEFLCPSGVTTPMHRPIYRPQ